MTEIIGSGFAVFEVVISFERTCLLRELKKNHFHTAHITKDLSEYLDKEKSYFTLDYHMTLFVLIMNCLGDVSIILMILYQNQEMNLSNN